MDTEIALSCLAITALCLVGFVRRPRSLYEMLMPRFVVPVIAWMASVSNVLFGHVMDLSVIRDSYEEYGGLALQFIALSLFLFWVGYFLPLGAGIGRSAPYLPVDLKKQSKVFLFGCLFLLLMLHTGWMLLGILPAVSAVVVIFMRIAPFGSAALLGLYLGSKDKLGFQYYLLAALALFGSMQPLMARFSRGAALPVFITLVAFSYMRRQIKIVPILLAAFAVVYFGVQGLRGRGVHGHYGGTVAYIEFLVTSPPAPSQMVGGMRLVHDVVRPTSVAMNARENRADYTGSLTVDKWLLNCIPLPRVVGLPKYTMSLGSYVAGKRISWGYTTSMFGDLVHHLGWLGSMMFIVVGAYYRAIEEAAFRKFGGPEYTSEWYSFLCIVSYYAFMLGMYNNFRSWLTLCAFGVYAIIGLILLKSVLGSRSQPPTYAAYPLHGPQTYRRY